MDFVTINNEKSTLIRAYFFHLKRIVNSYNRNLGGKEFIGFRDMEKPCYVYI